MSSSPSQVCARGSLLDLPPEIRNNIYELVLTHPDGVVRYVLRYITASRSYDSRIQNVGAYPKKSLSSAYNNLQYVCKALRQETHLLELKYNKLSFTSYIPTLEASFRAEGSATCAFLSFFANIPALKRLWIRDVELRSGLCPTQKFLQTFQYPIYDSKATLFRLASLCRRYPKMNVKYRVPTFTGAFRWACPALRAVIHGESIKYLLRHKEMDLTVVPRWFHPPVSYAQDFGAAWSGYTGPGDTEREKVARQLQTSNLRFYPMEDLIAESMFQSRRTFALADGRDAMPVWKELVMGWSEEGL